MKGSEHLSFPLQASPPEVKEAAEHRRVFLRLLVLAQAVQAALTALGQLCHNVHAGVVLDKGLATLLQLLEFSWVCQDGLPRWG